MKRAGEFNGWNESSIVEQAEAVDAQIQTLLSQEGDENWADLRNEMGHAMEAGCGIYRQEDLMQQTMDKLAELKQRYKNISLKDKTKVFNTDLIYAIEISIVSTSLKLWCIPPSCAKNRVAHIRGSMKDAPNVMIKSSSNIRWHFSAKMKHLISNTAM